LLALGKGEYSDVINLGSGWAFFRVEDAVQNSDFDDSSVIEKVRSYIREFERGRMEDWATEQARAFIGQVEEFDFNEAVYQRGIEKRSFGPLPVNYGNVDLYTSLSSFPVNELSGSYVDENFWKTAFSTPVNTPSEPLVQGSNVLVLYPTEEIAAEESSIEGIESMVSSYWLSYMTEQTIRSYFLNSKKMEDRFFETFFRYFMPLSD
ncbi:MAG: peptidylprolyl isomerase, partial [Treponema sp.]|nr:peptidylprolyl isomerase [Treponema sp.]